MAPASVKPPALISLLIFLCVNYVVGYDIGHLLTGSKAVGVAVALLMPSLSLVVLALPRRRRMADEEWRLNR